MKRKFRPSIFQRNAKKEIMKRARKGVFDRNPLLAAPHELICKVCGCARKITYLNYMKSGKFEFGETQVVEVSYAAPTIFGPSHAMERITPIIITIKCEKCRTKISCSPVSLEYLLFTTSKQQKMKNMYV